MYKNGLLAVGVGLGILGPSGPASIAWAQSEPNTALRGIEEIVVVAQRREERLLDVPISVSAVSAETLAVQGVTDSRLLQTVSPSLQYRQQVNSATPFIRGVGTSNGTAGNEPSVSTYVDGVYIPNGQATLFSFNNIERIEVLRGPQGTLFGRNATGGVVNIITLDPAETPKLAANASYSNFNTYEGSIYASSRLANGISGNIAIHGREQNKGWGKNLTLGEDVYKGYDYGFRGKIKWEPSDRTVVLLSANYSQTLSEQGINLIIQPGYIGNGGATFRGHYSPIGGSIDTNLAKQTGGSLKVTHDFGLASLVSISGYSRYRTKFTLDQDAGPVNVLSLPYFVQRGDTFTQEIQLLSPSNSKLTWIVGGYYLYDKAGYDPQLASSATIASLNRLSYSLQTTNSVSVFGQATYKFLPKTDLTVGLRYTSDDREILARRTSLAGALLPGTAIYDERKFSKMTYRMALSHHFTQEIMGYVSYNRGFKSGIYNVANPTAPPVRPEVLDAWEAGAKADLFDRRLRFSTSGFVYDYKEIQLTQIVTGTSNLFNAAQAKIYGAELELSAMATQNIRIDGGITYLHGQYKDFPNGPFNTPNPSTCDANPLVPGNQPAQTGPATGGNLQCPVDLSGNATIQTPKIVFNISLNWKIPTNVGGFDFNAGVYHNSGFFWEPDNGNRQKAYTLVNTALKWTTPNERFYVQVWGRNLFDKYYSAYAASTSFGTTETPAPPRTFGVTLGYAN